MAEDKSYLVLGCGNKLSPDYRGHHKTPITKVPKATLMKPIASSTKQNSTVLQNTEFSATASVVEGKDLSVFKIYKDKNCFVKINQHQLLNKYQHLISHITKKFQLHQQKFNSRSGTGSNNTKCAMLLLAILSTAVCCQLMASMPIAVAATTTANIDHQSQHLRAQARVGGLDPSDYIDEAGELEIMANQPQISTAQLMSAAGHLVPDNFFLPGSSVPAMHSRFNALAMAAAAAAASALQQSPTTGSGQQKAQGASQQQADQDPLQAAASSLHAARVSRPYGTNSGVRSPLDLLAAASEQQQQQQQQQQHENAASLIDFNGYNLAASPDGRDGPGQMDLAEFLAAGSSQQQQQVMAHYEQQLAAAIRDHQQQQQQQQHHHQITAGNAQQQHPFSHEQQQQALFAELTAMASQQQQQQQAAEHQQEAGERLQAASSENYLISSASGVAGSIGPDYQIEGQDYGDNQSGAKSASDKHYKRQYYGNNNNNLQQQRPFGLPTKNGRKPSDLLEPLGNPKTVSSPVVDFVNNLPKTSTLEKLAEKLPASQTPTVFSFSSNKDPVGDKAKGINQKKRTVMRQAEQTIRMLIKSINDKFGTNLGDQTDIPFLLSTIGPLGFAQNVLGDPSLLVSILNAAEKTYFSDVLPGPAKSVIRPVLNIFRVPNKKKDKANLLNIISYLTSGSQIAPGSPSKHRQSFGIEKSSNKNKNNHNKR